MKRVRVAVIFGGQSSEHLISCLSAGGIIGALDPAKYEVIPVGITTAGTWVRETADLERFRTREGVLPAVDPEAPATSLAELGPLDVVFPVLHGPWGEDGTIQGVLELAGIPYVGSGVLASALSMDKAFMKAIFSQAGLPVEPYEVITDRQWHRDPVAALARVRALGPVVFVKPARGGSSNGISKVSDLTQLTAAIDMARLHDPKVVVEVAVEGGREVECGVIVDGDPRASRCAEIIVRTGHEFYDFEAKYLDDSTDLVVPAQLTTDEESEVQSWALAAFEAVGCEGLARVDFFITADGRVVINEINTMPGFTPISMFPRMWGASGREFPDLVDHLIRDALGRGTGLR